MERPALKQISNLFIKMFQTLEFKLHLGLSYIANLKELSNFKQSTEGILSLGVQLITIDEIIMLILKDPVLITNFTSVLSHVLTRVLTENNRENLWRCSYLGHDLKYMSKPLVVPYAIRETNLMALLLFTMKQLHFADSVANPTSMQEFSDDTKFELI